MKKKAMIVILIFLVLLTCAGLGGVLVVARGMISSRSLQARWMGAQYLGREGVLLQKQRDDCGSTALKMVFDHFGISASADEFKQLAEPGSKGVSMLRLKAFAESKGLRAEGWRLRLDNLQEVSLPAIVLLHGSHFAVLAGMDSNGSIEVLDPSLGHLRFTRSCFQRVWSGEALLFASSGSCWRMKTSRQGGANWPEASGHTLSRRRARDQ